MYIRNQKLVYIDNAPNTLFSPDPIETAKHLESAGIEGILCTDLNISPVEQSPNLSIIKQIHNDFNMGIYVSGNFKTEKEIAYYLDAGIELIVLDSIAYQKPDFVEVVSEKYPSQIAAHIDVKNNRVIIPGYAVVSNKTAFDYAESFIQKGIRYILYSDVSADGHMHLDNFQAISKFCNETTARIIITSEIQSLSDIEKLIQINITRIQGLVLAKALYEERIDLRGAITMVNDLILSRGSDVTLTEM